MNPYLFEISNQHQNKFCSHKTVHVIFYPPKWNFVSAKITDMKSIPAMSFKRICALNAISNDSALIHFVSGKFCSYKISCRFEISFWSRWPIYLYHFEFHFTSIHVNTSKELAKYRSEIFNRNEISYQFEFISPLMWTYS